jgi:hypothetical protein
MTMGWYQDGLRAMAERAGHPLSCSIWKDAVCDCTDARDLCRECGFPGGHWGSCPIASGYWHPRLEPGLGVVHAEELDVVASDTDRPPAPEKPTKCYWCGAGYELDVYHGIPSCADCKRRAVGRRSK